MIPCATETGAFIGSLDFNVDLMALAVHGVNVQPYISAHQVLHDFLRSDALYGNVIPVQDDPKEKFCSLDVVIEAGVHEIVVDEPEAPDALQILLVQPFLVHVHRIITCINHIKNHSRFQE